GKPVALNVGTGLPVAVTVKVPALPAVKVVWFALVMVGVVGAGLTVNVKFCVASGKTPFAAVMVMAKGEPVVLGGVPLSTPVVGSRVAQPGKPVALKVG